MTQPAETLTAAQQEAVTDASPALIVLAGPGTGKTRVIIHRIEHLVRARGVSPQSILAVTYTVRAAEELSERLGRLLGRDAAHVRVHTFNGYGMRIVQRFAAELGLPPTQRLIDPVQANRMMREIILRHDLVASDLGEGLRTAAAGLQRRCDELADFGVLPDEAEACAAKRLAELGPGAEPGELALAGRFADEAKAYRLMLKERWSRGLLTYSDQLLLPLRLLRDMPGPASLVRGEFTHVIVDEFQDCNPAQLAFLRRLAPAPGVGPRLCAVGDDDQSIYGFRGADDRAFARLMSWRPEARIIALGDNFRSTPPIVRVACDVIGRAGLRFRADKEIRAAAGDTAPNVEAIVLSSYERDAEVITAQILEEQAKTGLPWREFAVIGRNNGDLERVAGALELAGVPFERAREPDILDEPGVDDVLAWCRWLVDPGATWDARRLLVRPPAGLAPSRVLELERSYRASGGRDYAEMLSRQPEPELRDLARRHAGLRGRLGGLRGDEAVQAVMLEIDPAHRELLPALERAKRVGALIALLSIARDIQPRLAPPGDLAALLDHLRELRELGGLRLQRALGDADAERVDAAGGQDGGLGRVRLTTAHSAKGLEFTTVFVTRLESRNGFPGRIDERWTPPAALHEPLDDRPYKARGIDEERRLFYVACTRARKRLVLLGTLTKSGTTATHFLEELIRGRSDLPITVRREDAILPDAAPPPKKGETARKAPEVRRGEVIAEARRRARLEVAMALDAASRPDIGEPELQRAQAAAERATARLAGITALEKQRELPAWLTPDEELRRLEGLLAGPAESGERALPGMPPPLHLSFTQIDRYLRCPACFYLAQQGLPEPSGDALELGVLVHRLLQDYFGAVRLADAEGRPAPDAADLNALVERHAVTLAGRPDAAEVVAQVKAQVRTALAMHDPRAHILELERQLTIPYEAGGHVHRLTAKLDRVDQLPDGSFRVVDYKTGAARSKLTEPARHDLQLGIYAMALEHEQGGPVRGVAEYWVLATGERGMIDFARLDRQKIKDAIDQAANGMMQGKFPRGADCRGPCALLDVSTNPAQPGAGD